MFLCLGLACVSTVSHEPTPNHAGDATVRYEHRSVRACAVIDEDSASFPHRLVFLHRTDGRDVDAQSELFAFDAKPFRCGEVALHLVPGRDGTPVIMDFMPSEDSVTLRELRIYRFDVPWDPENPYALATEDHAPFRDYVFRVNLVLPPFDDASTILLPEHP